MKFLPVGLDAFVSVQAADRGKCRFNIKMGKHPIWVNDFVKKQAQVRLSANSFQGKDKEQNNDELNQIKKKNSDIRTTV